MKNTDGKDIHKIRSSWTIDPIKSFMDGAEGAEKKVLITAGRHPITIDNSVFWRTGKRAFDTINSSYDRDITASDIAEFFGRGPTDLIELWNRYKSAFEPLIRKRVVQIIPFGSEEPIQEFTRLYPNSDGFAKYYIVEPYIRAFDDVFEAININNNIEEWPFNRELVGAFFTICNIDFFASSVAIGRVDENANAIVTYWFDKIDLYEHTKSAIDEHQELLKRQKSQSMNDKRHAKSHEAKQMVIDNYSKGPSDFRNGAQAGRFYAQWLEEMGFEYELETITKWIRDFAKENGIKLR